jgi:hypothetical protein
VPRTAPESVSTIAASVISTSKAGLAAATHRNASL